MFGLCVFFAFVLTVVCDVDVVVETETPTGLGLEPGRLVENYLRTHSDGSLKGVEYKVNLEDKVKKYLKCTWQPVGHELSFENPAAECKEEYLGSATLLYGIWNGKVESPEEIVNNVKNYWNKDGDDGGEEELNAAIEEAKVKGAKSVGCAFYYLSKGVFYYEDGEGDGNKESAIGDLAEDLNKDCSPNYIQENQFDRENYLEHPRRKYTGILSPYIYQTPIDMVYEGLISGTVFYKCLKNSR
ncbi:unnamed protein product [Cylicocyclus nassatus]|uniref:Uncharacterized protein n=1 Tax=Cylicocyclus nassatus TaxID=53992 RepID=A0AA36H1A2_CYLNA|nr:unnamed protein product [Cylicocyclus nassatus]